MMKASEHWRTSAKQMLMLKEIMKDERTMKFGCKKMFGNLTSLEEHR